jgi:RNA polymerase sigma-32 factor
MTRLTRPRGSTPTDPIDLFLAEIRAVPLLTAEEETRLARAWRNDGDARAAHALITANLRFVVKVANEYRTYGFRLADLIQEGNIGLMKAVQKFDPEKQIRLISYAVWWIRAYIQNYILRSWSLVKIGTTQAQRKLFFSLARTKRELERHGDVAEAGEIAERLHVRTVEVTEMERRMDGRDLSLDAPWGEDGSSSHGDHVAWDGTGADDEMGSRQERRMASDVVKAAIALLDERERFIIQNRILGDAPMTLKDVGAHFGFSRERARQLELRAKEKLRRELQSLAVAIDWPVNGRGVELEVE